MASAEMVADGAGAPRAPPVALFELDGDGRFVPTQAAAGPWHRGVLHGGAVGALLVGLLDDPDQVLARVLIDLLGPVPSAPLRADLDAAEGGRRVARQSVVLHAEDRPVARAFAVRMRREDLDLPEAATRHPVVFDPALAPDLSVANQHARDAIGWDCFDSLAMAFHADRTSERPAGRRVWLKMLVPVLPDRPLSPVENVVACADYGTTGTSARLDFRSWSFMNADLVVSLSRPPVGEWVGLECDGLLSRTGTGQSVAAIHDAGGLLGRSSQSILVEARPR